MPVRIRRSFRAPGSLAAFLFLAPFLAFYGAFLVVPLLLGAWMSLHRWELLGDLRAYCGSGNYLRMLRDPLFRSSLVHSAQFTLMAVPTITAVALFLALVMNRPHRLYAALRSIFFASGALSVTAVTLIWLMVLNPSRGLFARFMAALGFAPVDLLADPRLAMPALVVTTLWWGIGFPMVLFLAGLQQIPRELYEAAKLDHASPWTTFRRITLPSLRRTILLVLVVEVILQFQVFGQVLLMTRGGPANRTRVLVQYIYETSFRDWQVGYAASMSMLLLLVMSVASFVQLRLSRPGD
ncbi:sugar ABC transporter permease [Polyangium sp. y55x31]|uniref:carbohydrate ABC transporter permease n=1 Tax=Polyangium sp. y55x31 TaxID=3042688 RepID=UPI00248259F1|nr:sugar ABC transporter permease [Polyangium sp. y55x31]MDI1475420.1 sugar ABC transporter permease [Polyangium sp. y55x31]